MLLTLMQILQLDTFFFSLCIVTAFDLSDIDISDFVEAVLASFTVRFSLGVCKMSGLCNQRSAVGLVEAPLTRRVYVLVQWLSFSSLQCSAPLLHTARPLIWPGGWYVFFSLLFISPLFFAYCFSVPLQGYFFTFHSRTLGFLDVFSSLSIPFLSHTCIQCTNHYKLQ